MTIQSIQEKVAYNQGYQQGILDVLECVHEHIDLEKIGVLPMWTIKNLQNIPGKDVDRIRNMAQQWRDVHWKLHKLYDKFHPSLKRSWAKE